MIEPHHSVAFNPHPSKGELSILFSGNSQTKASHKVGPQVLDYYLIHYVVSGRGTFRCMGHDYHLEKGGSFVIFPGELVSYISDETDPWSYRWVGFKGTRADEYLHKLGLSQHQPVNATQPNRKMNALFFQLEQTLHIRQSHCDMQSQGYLRLILAEYGQKRSSANVPVEDSQGIQQQVEQAIRWLTLQYHQPISIEQMAQSLGYHRTHLSKMFKQHTGMSPMNFLLKIRMERAKLLLQETLTIEQVASSVGFSDALYFSKQFRKWFGRSPSDYRQDQTTNPYDCRQ
ncbi:AraC family transcriptional regulator [Paenibacillus radicis (ex Xue et al. 2023)]|uniref:AraC family transcriptional regulator n=1 Tax=Paenibacillus radicis (ex Xue et al. 2023) TaxID=2972489 RepID=A0ABT1YFQ3_9BACL|nr:AraC family transcriptional regulator [Paenibacillus radicis (ex Xue et al. 2023)]MCR8631048.1 AraC family transcriptional regulator [Paenibacillus radicis (ex Xue et al. 2023)]